MEVPSKSILSVEHLYEDESMSIARVALSGVNRATINHRSTTAYAVIEGEGIMIVNGVEHELYAGQVVIVPKDTLYCDQGEVEMVAISVPPFDVATIEYLE